MKKKVLFCLLALIIILILGGLVIYLSKVDIKLNKHLVVDINTEHKVGEFVDNITNGTIINENEKITFNTTGKKAVTIKYQNKFKKVSEKKIEVTVLDEIKPEIESEDKIEIIAGENADLISLAKVTDNSNEKLNPKIIGDYDLNTPGEYNLKYTVKDSSGNEAEKKFTLVVKEKPQATIATVTNSNYYVKVNKTMNVAMVYTKDEKGEFTNLVKTFVVSTGGENTPNGIWYTSTKAETLLLVGDVYGHYTTQIIDAIWFHSVPYFTAPREGHWDNLEYEEYNKLGTTASLGCVRLSTIDAKWIFENLPWQTPVEIYESDALPEGVVKPEAIKIDVESENRGWDPTDPDPENPWNFQDKIIN